MPDVLIVDDSNSIRNLVANTLSQAGCSVAMAEDGIKGLEEAEQQDFRLVITDINMPEMDGLTMLRHLRELSRYVYRPILILTTERSDEMKKKGREAGATGWIVKPFEPEGLTKIVTRLLA